MTSPEMAVTGIGVISAIGVGYAEFASAVTQGVIGLGPCTADEEVTAAEVLDWDVRPYLVAEKTYLDRCSEFALAAAKLCLDDAGLAAMPAEEERAGLALGTAFGCFGTMSSYRERVAARGPRSATPVLFSHAFANTPASLVAIDFRLRGYHATLTSGAVSGEAALTAAIMALACGHSEAILAGGAEALTPELVSALGSDLGDDPDSWDPYQQSGTALGEGAALLLLEPVERARGRGATIRALVRLSDEADGEELWISGANGTVQAGTPPPAALTSAPKGLYGESLGASGALAAATAVAALETATVPPVRGGAEPLEARRESRSSPGLERAALGAGGSPTRPLRLVFRRP